jgi:hypothetical protein
MEKKKMQPPGIARGPAMRVKIEREQQLAVKKAATPKVSRQFPHRAFGTR